MDGNGRWAEKRGLARVEGHRAGAEAARRITEECNRLGVKRLTLYAFSLENWKRPKKEVDTLMNLLRRFLIEKKKEISKNNVKLTVIGRLDHLPPETRREVDKTVRETAGRDGLNLCLAISYGGRAEVVDAARSLAHKVKQGRLEPDDIDENLFSRHLYQPGEDPDMVIRTAGEMRLSNFLLWQSSYSEIYVTDVCWPDFTVEKLHEALDVFESRVRKFGGLESGDRNERSSRTTL